MALSNADIKVLYTDETGFILDDSPAALLDFAKAIEDAVRKDYEALIRQIVEALESSSPHTDVTYAWKCESWTAKRAAAITAAQARLATTTKESPCSTK